jgi:hypothetical protein
MALAAWLRLATRAEQVSPLEQLLPVGRRQPAA